MLFSFLECCLYTAHKYNEGGRTDEQGWEILSRIVSDFGEKGRNSGHQSEAQSETKRFHRKFSFFFQTQRRKSYRTQASGNRLLLKSVATRPRQKFSDLYSVTQRQGPQFFAISLEVHNCSQVCLSSATPTYTFVTEHGFQVTKVDERPLPPHSESMKCLSAGVLFKKQVPRPTLAQPKRLNERRFVSFQNSPMISTTVKRVSTPSFSKQRNRPELFVENPALLLSYTPKFKLVEKDLGKNGVKMALAPARLSLALRYVTDLPYRTGNKSTEKRVPSLELNRSASRPKVQDSALPTYMRKVQSRLGMTCILDKSLRMNGSMYSPYDSEEESSFQTDSEAYNIS